MSDNGSLFIQSDESSEGVAAWLGDALGLEVMVEEPGREIGLRGRATGDGGLMGFVVRPNGHAEYRPGVGTKYFDAGTTPDGPDLAVWEPWL